MGRRATTWAAAVLGAALAAGGGDASAGDDPPKVSAATQKAVEDFLAAPRKAEKEALGKALKALGGDLAVAAAALRGHAPLTDGRPGARHDLSFTSGTEGGGRTFPYSIRLPKGYDGKRRFPVLVLPDHALVSQEKGISFWEAQTDVEDFVLFRPVILKSKDDRKVFPESQFFAIDQAIALVMRDALAHLRLHYAVDPDRIAMTGLSQSGYYTWYYAVSFPDDFAGIVPESAGGTAVRAAVRPLAGNLRHVAVRILHTEGDTTCPFADAEMMRDALREAESNVELIAYTDADYPGTPPPGRHPGPHNLRLRNVYSWIGGVRRTIPSEWTRVLRYAQQGREGRFLVPPPKAPTDPVTVACSEKDGVLTATGTGGVVYLVAPQDVAAGKEFTVGAKKVKPKADLRFLLEDFKRHGDAGRLAAAQIPVE